MALNCGIIGLPNVGKSTIFSALTNSQVERENYPFCTIEPNKGIVAVQDKRLDALDEIIKADKKIYATCEFVDIAGLVKGASQGEGLGNKFLSHVRDVNCLIHVVRCFEDEKIVHVDGTVDPLRDISTVETELVLADIETISRYLEKFKRQLSTGDKLTRAHNEKIVKFLEEKCLGALNNGIPGYSLELDEDEQEIVRPLSLLTFKPVLFVANVDEAGINTDSEYVKQVKVFAEKRGFPCLKLCASLEADIASLESAEERELFLHEAGLEEPILNELVRTSYDLLTLRTFFTVGEKENKAWTFKAGATAPETAGIIHTDFEKGFIRAEVYPVADLLELGSEAAVKQHGKMRVEGKGYEVQDGDVMFFRFNV